MLAYHSLEVIQVLGGLGTQGVLGINDPRQRPLVLVLRFEQRSWIEAIGNREELEGWCSH